jgi:steroid delta-isomerase-like uncharacterized protein
MSAEANKTTVRRLFDAFNRGDLSALDALITADHIDHTPYPVRTPGREGWKQTVAMLRAAFPDMQQTVDDLLADGDKVVARWTGRGTHQGAYRGIPPTGRPVIITGIHIFRLTDGQIAESWAEGSSVLPQIGASAPQGDV